MSSSYLKLQDSYNNYMNQNQTQTHNKLVSSKELPLSYWWNWYSKGLFILTLFSNMDSEENKESMYCFITSLFKMFPKSEIRNLASDFIESKDYVIDLLKTGCKAFFTSYHSYLEVLELSRNIPYSFLRACLQSSESMFIFIYLFQSFILIMHNKQGHNVTIPYYNDMVRLYDPTKIDKYDWGRPLWFILHTIALYAPEPLTESFKNYKQILTCLQYLLPCPKCRFHLSENLLKINLDTCARTRQDLFKCSWDLHNIVNKDTNKPVLSFYEALQIYTPI
jgi:hypothetical protein